MTTVIILAGGVGKRMNKDITKQLIKIGGEHIINITIEVFEKCVGVEEIVLVVNKKDKKYIEEEIRRKKYKKIKKVVLGGEERQNSVYEGLKEVSKSSKIIIHDGARPFIKEEDIMKVIDGLEKEESVTLGVRCKNTIKQCSKKRILKKGLSLERESLVEIQTPQGFKLEVIKEAHEKAKEDGYIGTDDTSLVERIGKKTLVVMGSYSNIKITTEEDLMLGEIINETNRRGEIKVISKGEEVGKKSIENKVQLEGEEIEIYTDGACSGNPGKGGYGVLLKYKGVEKEISEGYELTTNNRMELLAVIVGLENLNKRSKVVIYTDSKYVSDAINKKWLKKWERENFLVKGVERVNVDLWLRLSKLIKEHDVRFEWVKGHSNNAGNERCDKLAVEGSQKGNLLKDEMYEKVNRVKK